MTPEAQGDAAIAPGFYAVACEMADQNIPDPYMEETYHIQKSKGSVSFPGSVLNQIELPP